MTVQAPTSMSTRETIPPRQLDAVRPAPASLGAWLGHELARFLSRRRHSHGVSRPTDPGQLAACLKPGDVILVEGESRFSAGIKYLTQSTWSHSALYVGGALGDPLQRCVVEADVVEGIRAVGLDEFAGLHVRVCRPVGLAPEEIRAVIGHAAGRIGQRYDLKNIVDLVRWLLPTPPVPSRWRRRLIALGSGDPTRAICSTLVAEAFQSVRYPILPGIERRDRQDPLCPGCVDEILHVRHHSLFVPRDFDVSPYFQVVKPTLEAGFDPHGVRWAQHPRTEAL
jgi:hypothetical protein